MDTIQDMIAAQRGELAAVLDALPASGWDEPTLCAGWRVREVVAHVTMPFRYSGRRFAMELVKSRGRFNEMADRVALRDAARMSAAELTEIVTSPATTLFVARDGDEGPIVGTLTLAMFRIPTGVRAWIEELPLSQAAEGYAALEQGRAHYRTVLTM